MFEKAIREKFRFPSNRGELTVENLFDLPLQSKSGFDLDNVAKELNATLKQMGEESFVSTNTPGRTLVEAKLELVKYVIKTRLDENAAKQDAARRASEIEKLESLLERKQDEALLTLTPEQIKEKLATLRS
jgi:hypothetical protein